MKRQISKNISIIECDGLGFILEVHGLQVHLEADETFCGGVYTEEEEMAEIQRRFAEEAEF